MYLQNVKPFLEDFVCFGFRVWGLGFGGWGFLRIHPDEIQKSTTSQVGF